MDLEVTKGWEGWGVTPREALLARDEVQGRQRTQVYAAQILDARIVSHETLVE